MENIRVTIEVNRQIATVTLNRPEKRNALDMPMFAALAKTFKQLKKDRSIRVIIVRRMVKIFVPVSILSLF